jgi:alpha-glucosidase
VDGPSFGFGTGPGWLPQPAGWAQLSVQAQEADRGSMLWFYREALRLRRELPALGAGDGRPGLTWLDLGPGVLAFRRGDVTCVVNTGEAAVPLPAGRILLRSDAETAGPLAPDAAAWLVAQLDGES